MERNKLPPVEESREGGRVWLLAVILAAMGLMLASPVIYTTMAASAAFFTHRIVQGWAGWTGRARSEAWSELTETQEVAESSNIERANARANLIGTLARSTK